MAKDDTPAWGSPEFQKAIEQHDEKADPEREKKGLKYTSTRNPANTPKDSKAKPKDPPKPKGGKGKK